MAYSTKIEIILINDRSAKDENKDDKVVIKKNLDYNEFEVTYTEHSGLDTPVVYKSTGMYREKVLEYVYMLVKNQYADDEPYKHVQVNIPAMPRVILSSQKFNEVYFREHLCDLISTGLDMLESTHVVKSKPVVTTPTYSDPPYYQNHNYYPGSQASTVAAGGAHWPPGGTAPSARSSVPGAVPQHLYWD